MPGEYASPGTWPHWRPPNNDSYGSRRPPKPDPQANDNKTPDPVTGGNDYAGLALPHYGPVTLNTFLGIGCVLREFPQAVSRRRSREVFESEVDVPRRALRRRVMRRRPEGVETRTWTGVRRNLATAFASAGDGAANIRRQLQRMDDMLFVANAGRGIAREFGRGWAYAARHDEL